MSAPAPHRELGQVLTDMDDKVAQVVRWATAVRDLGCATSALSPDGVFAIGCALYDDAKAVEADWEHALDLYRQSRGAER